MVSPAKGSDSCIWKNRTAFSQPESGIPDELMTFAPCRAFTALDLGALPVLRTIEQ